MEYSSLYSDGIIENNRAWDIQVWLDYSDGIIENNRAHLDYPNGIFQFGWIIPTE